MFITGLRTGCFRPREREGTSEDAALERAPAGLRRDHVARAAGPVAGADLPGGARSDPGAVAALDDLPADSLAQPRRARITVPAPRIVDGDWAGRAGRPRPSRAYDEHDQRTAYDDEPVFRVDDAGGFVVGAEVTHAALGSGRVVAVTGTGKDCRVVVDFGTVGRKTVFAKFLDPT